MAIKQLKAWRGLDRWAAFCDQCSAQGSRVCTEALALEVVLRYGWEMRGAQLLCARCAQPSGPLRWPNIGWRGGRRRSGG